jgi:hypothetical protein
MKSIRWRANSSKPTLRQQMSQPAMAHPNDSWRAANENVSSYSAIANSQEIANAQTLLTVCQAPLALHWVLQLWRHWRSHLLGSQITYTATSPV